MAIDLINGVFTGFCTGLGTGLANYMILKHFENKKFSDVLKKIKVLPRTFKNEDS